MNGSRPFGHGLRRALEYVSRHVYFTRRLPARFSSLRVRVSPGASLGYYRGLRQPGLNDLYDYAERYVRPGDTVWDVGSNMGVFAFAAAARAGTGGRVLCVEPDLWSVRLLRRSCAFNRGRAAPVDVLPAAVSGRCGLEWLNIPERSRAVTHLESAGGAGAELVGGIRERHLTPAVTLDFLADNLPAPRVLKIDVDGAELGVLAGGGRLFREHRPILLVEVYERNADAVSALLLGHGYSLFDYSGGEAGRRPVSRAVYNTLALPPGTAA
jgi:FkbM family methyltransferase